jgi:hypothetical protein
MKLGVLAASAALVGFGAGAASALPVIDFTGDYAFGNFSVGGTGCASGGVATSGAASVTIAGCNGGTETSQWLSYTVTSADNGFVNFSYDLTNNDSWGSGFDHLLIALNDLEHNVGSASGSGTGVSFEVSAGDTFGWIVWAEDDLEGELVATISGFSLTEAATGAVLTDFEDIVSAPSSVPVPAAFGLLGMAVAGLFAAGRRRAAA